MSEQIQSTPAQSTPAAETNTGTTQETSSTQSTSPETVQAGQGQSTTQTQTPAQAEVVFDLKLPENTTLTKEYVDKVASFAKENGLTPAQAQKVLERDHAYFAETQKSAKENFEKQIGDWEKQVQEDKTLGGDNFAANMEFAKRGFEKFSTPELKKILNQSGYGSHPEVVRMFFAIGKAMSDDSFHKGGGTKAEPSTAGALLYGN